MVTPSFMYRGVEIVCVCVGGGGCDALSGILIGDIARVRQ